MGLQPGEIIDGKYRILRLLGEGGMGAVYEAENARIARKVAIKVLLGDAAGRPDVVQRFEREAQAAGRIGSDHILEILDFGNLPNGDRFMVMEYLDGEELSARIKRGVLTPEQCVPLFTQLLEGLEAAHAAGIVHRDLKPDNIFILREKAGRPDFVKIIDFGISKFNQLNDPDHEKTKTGMLMGTPYYLSPEQARGAARSDPRSDVYSCGVILYQCVTGMVPFDAETLNELLFAIVLSQPRPIAEVAPHLDPHFRAVIDKAMARELHDRFQSAKEFHEALLAWSRGGGFVSAAPAVADLTGSQPAVVGGTMPMPAVASVAAAQAPNLPTDTRASWSQSQPLPAAKRSNMGLLLGAAGGVFLLLSVLAVGVWVVLKRPPAEVAEVPSEADVSALSNAGADAAASALEADAAREAQDAGAEPEATLDAAAEGEPAADDPPADAPPELPADPVANTPRPAPGPRPAATQRPATPGPAPTPTPTKGPDFGY